MSNSDRVEKMLKRLDAIQDEAFWAGNVNNFVEVGKTIKAIEEANGYPVLLAV